MARRIPPLNQLRAFEAAARRESFRRAGDELGVTHAAISHQVKALEAFLGVKLFNRMTRAVSLTKEAAAYYPILRNALDSIEDGTVRLLRHKETKTLKISVVPTLATRWLIPRMSRFNTVNPDIVLQLDVGIELVNFDCSDVDLAIRHGSGDWEGLIAHRLFPEEILPVCSPSLFKKYREPKEPADLLEFTLLGANARKCEWPRWFEAAGMKNIEPPHVLHYPTQALALDAAVGGLGIALADPILVTDDVTNARLQCPFNIKVSNLKGYHLVYAKSAILDPKVTVFHAWLKDELVAKSAANEPAPAMLNREN